MRLVHDIFLEQQQKLLMTPELRQAIAILQMSTMELNEFINGELEENPFLEERENEETEKTVREETDDTAWLEQAMDLYHDRDIGIAPRERQEERSFDNYLTRVPSLFEHLEFQLRLVRMSKAEYDIGYYLIGNLDSNGYLCEDLNEVSRKMQAPLEQVEKVLHIIHSFHPHGVGARTLSECLLLQLRHYGKESCVARRIIEEHLDDLARGKMNKIAGALGISVQQTQEICDLIRTLNPKPGRPYSSEQEIRYIVPEIFVEKVGEEYVVYVNDLNFPHLVVNSLYESVLRQPDNFPAETRKYLEEKIGSALWLIRSIEQRRITLYKVASCIVDIQKDFLDKGVQYLKPLKLQQVAKIVNVHESTVSRATSNKYMQTPQGLFELKYFFSTGLESKNHEKMSSKSIKHMLETMIEGENPSRPLSDEQIAQIFKQKGINISRRTVAKYRQELGISSAMSRKRY